MERKAYAVLAMLLELPERQDLDPIKLATAVEKVYPNGLSELQVIERVSAYLAKYQPTLGQAVVLSLVKGKMMLAVSILADDRTQVAILSLVFYYDGERRLSDRIATLAWEDGASAF